jgi:penicillin amidase
MHWTLYEPSNDLKAFYLLNRAGDYGEYRKALDLLNCPAQNFVFADNSRDIAMTVAGKIPIRRDNNSEYVLDGSRDENNWAGWIPDDQKPAARNPAAGFVSSANQSLTDSAYPYLLPGNYGDPSRAIRINERLNAMNGATVDSMRVLQNDAYSEIAKNVLPALLKRLDKKNEESAHAEVSELGHWDFNFHGTSEAASIFQEWWNQLYTQIWEDDIAHAPYRIPWPDDAKTVNIILRDTTSHWINNAETGKKETMTSLVNVSFQKCIETLRTKYGPLGTTWQWGNVRSSVIHHLAGIDAFSCMVTNGDGAPNTINALSNNFGPSWRMVVELGPVVKGYGVLPGGESGNPGSYFYDNSIRAWQEGKLNDMLFLNDKNDNSTGILETLDIKN